MPVSSRQASCACMRTRAKAWLSAPAESLLALDTIGHQRWAGLGGVLALVGGQASTTGTTSGHGHPTRPTDWVPWGWVRISTPSGCADLWRGPRGGATGRAPQHTGPAPIGSRTHICAKQDGGRDWGQIKMF